MHKIITIGRHFSSGGREVGKKLADVLGYAYYDKELLNLVASETGLAVDYIEKYSESDITRSYAYMYGRSFASYKQTPVEKLQIAQNNAIKELAQKGPCIFVGRCADYVLHEENPLKVFVYSSNMKSRIQRCFDKVPEDKAKGEAKIKKQILEIDKQRARYYEFITCQKWANYENYNLCIDTSFFNVDKAVEIIKNAVENT